MCRKQPGIAIGRLCDKCDGKCPVCDSYVRPTTLVRICDECSFGNYQNKCVVCGGEVSFLFFFFFPFPYLCTPPPLSVSLARGGGGSLSTGYAERERGALMICVCVCRASRTRSTASNARGWKRTGTGVRRLSTWAARGRTSFTRRRISAIIDGRRRLMLHWQGEMNERAKSM